RALSRFAERSRAAGAAPARIPFPPPRSGNAVGADRSERFRKGTNGAAHDLHRFGPAIRRPKEAPSRGRPDSIPSRCKPAPSPQPQNVIHVVKASLSASSPPPRPRRPWGNLRGAGRRGGEPAAPAAPKKIARIPPPPAPPPQRLNPNPGGGALADLPLPSE